MDIESLQKFYSKEVRKQNWNIDHDTGKYLYQFILSHSIQSVLELGTSIGVSASYMALALQKHQGLITTIESHKGRREIALKNFNELGLDNINSISGHAPNILNSLHDNYELIFLDCIKLYYTDITKYILKNWKNTRFIIADNAVSHEKSLSEFFEVIKNLKTEKILIGSGLIMIHLER